MNIVRSKKVSSWLFNELVDAIVYLFDLWLRFLLLMGWSPKLKRPKSKKT